jgi:hypothetical protein
MDGQTKEGLQEVKITKTKILNLRQFCGEERGNYIKNLQLALVSKLLKESRKNKPPLTGRVKRSAENKSPFRKPLF